MLAMSTTASVLRFEGLELDLGRGALREANGKDIPLRPKSFALLRLFVENAERLLDRDMINRAIWPDVTVTDESITQCVRDVRRAIGDSRQHLLKTVPRRGYIFEAKVTNERLQTPAQATGTMPLAETPSNLASVASFRGSNTGAVMAVNKSTSDSSLDRRKLIAVMYADMVGYSRLIGLDDVGTVQRLRLLRRDLIDPAILEHGGILMQTGGDSLLVAFDSIEGAVRCAAKVQQQTSTHDEDQKPDRRIRFRIGINIGDVLRDGTDLHGDGVNVAVRLQAECPPGGICVSRTVRDHLQHRPDLAFKALGELRLKNISRPVEAYILCIDLSSAAAMDQRLPTRGNIDAPLLPDKLSIAVLPFANLSGEPGQDYFVDGIVEDIILALSRVRWILVIARNSSFTYKGKSIDVRQVGRELGVRYLLEGSVRKVGRRVRVTAQLIDALSGAHVWVERFDAALEDIFELQDLVASGVVGQVAPKLRLTEAEHAHLRPVNSFHAYDLYLHAMHEIRQYTAASISKAVALLKQAMAVEPSYAHAAALIADCRVTMQSQGWRTLSDEEIAETINLARQAIEWGKDDPDALCWASLSLSYFTHDRITAANLIDRALELNANCAHAWRARAWVHCQEGQANAAIASFDRALRLNPLDPMGGLTKGGLALAYFVLGNYKVASVWADRSLSDFPGFMIAIRVKVAACAHMGQLREARDWLRRLLELQPDLTIRRWRELVSALASDVRNGLEQGLRIAGLPED